MKLALVWEGKCSTFGGPDDTGVRPSEDLALYDRSDLKTARGASLFLPQQPKGTTGLARRLNPKALYVACRWPYTVVGREWLRTHAVRVSVRGKPGSVEAWPVDWGPHKKTGRIVDCSPRLLVALGVKTDDVLEVTVILEGEDCP